jgi:hypothetical protein
MGIRELFIQMKEQPSEAAQITLIPVGHRYVGFSGHRDADGPLTLGQSNTLQWVTDIRLYTRMTDWALDLPEGATLDDIAAAFSVLMARHESLRTTGRNLRVRRHRRGMCAPPCPGRRFPGGTRRTSTARGASCTSTMCRAPCSASYWPTLTMCHQPTRRQACAD